jgi:hypothetical protein
MFGEFMTLAVGCAVLGLVASVMGGSILPLIVLMLVVWSGSSFAGGMSGGGKKKGW